MRKRSTITILAIAAACLGATAAAALATGPWIHIYVNALDTPGKRAQMEFLRGTGGPNCIRGGSPTRFRVKIGEKTKECAYRTPVVGRDLEIFGTVRLLTGTPRSERKRTFVALNLRNGNAGAKYQLAVWPARKKFVLLKDLPDGTRKYLAVGRQIGRIHHVPKATRLRLRAWNLPTTKNRNDVRLLVFIGGKLLAVVTDKGAKLMQGRYTSVSVGAGRHDKGAAGSFADLTVRVPNPY